MSGKPHSFPKSLIPLLLNAHIFLLKKDTYFITTIDSCEKDATKLTRVINQRQK